MNLQVRKLIKIFVIIFFCFITVYFVIVFSVPYFVNLNNFKDSLFKSIENETGFKVSCENIAIVKGVTPYLKLHLFHTGVLYPDNEKFVQIKEADLKVKILPLFIKKVEIKDIILDRPIINITLYKDFSTSIEKFFNNQFIKPSNSYKIDSTIPIIKAKNYKIKFKDNSINKIFYLEGNDLALINLKLNDSVRILINGSIFENKKEFIKYDLDILTSLDLKKPKFTFSPFKTIYDMDIKADIFACLKKDIKNNINGILKINNLALNSGFVSARNNISLVFNNNDVEISSIIHTSTKDYAKINGKFNFGKNKYINVNTEAKNVDLENLLKIINTSLKVLNINNPLIDINAKGVLNSDFNIKSDFNNIKSNGAVEIVNAFLLHKSFKYPISNINANINFNNNEINIEKAIANINKTPIKIEGFIKNDLTANLTAFSENLELKSVLSDFNVPFIITNGNFNFKTSIEGNLAKNIKTHSEINIKNLNVIEKTYKIPFNIKNCLINISSNNKNYIGDIKLENVFSTLNKKQIKLKDFSFTFDDNNIKIPKNIITIVDSPLTIDGNILNYKSKNPDVKLNFTGSIKSNNLADIISPYIKQPYKAKGILFTKGSIAFENAKLKFKTQVSSDKDNYISYLVIKELLNKPSITKFDVEINKDLITLKDISISKGNENKVKINGEIENIKNPVLKNVNLSIPNEITIASNFLGGEEISLKTDLFLNDKISKPTLKGNVKILKFNIKKYLTSIKNTDLSFSPENIRIIAPDIMINNSLLNITADVKPDLKNIFVSNMQVNSLNLDVNSLFKIIQDSKDIFLKIPITVKNGSSEINNFKILDIKSSDVISDFKIDKNILKVTNINAKAYNGNIQGRIEYEIPSGILNINMIGKNLNVKTSLYDLCRLNDNISGIADIIVQVSMLTGGNNTIIKTLSGSMDFNAKNGTMGALGKFEYYLYAQNLLYHGLLNTTLNRLVQTISHDDTTHYNTASGRILLQNGWLITDNIHTQGNKMSLFIKGRHNILTNQSNLDIYGRITDEISKKLGSFGDISISNLMNNQTNRKDNLLISVPNSIIKEINFLNNDKAKSNTFKVNVMGKLDALNSINSFNWIISEERHGNKEIKETEEETEREKLPDFADL